MITSNITKEKTERPLAYYFNRDKLTGKTNVYNTMQLDTIPDRLIIPELDSSSDILESKGTWVDVELSNVQVSIIDAKTVVPEGWQVFCLFHQNSDENEFVYVMEELNTGETRWLFPAK